MKNLNSKERREKLGAVAPKWCSLEQAALWVISNIYPLDQAKFGGRERNPILHSDFSPSSLVSPLMDKDRDAGKRIEELFIALRAGKIETRGQSQDNLLGINHKKISKIKPRYFDLNKIDWDNSRLWTGCDPLRLGGAERVSPKIRETEEICRIEVKTAQLFEVFPLENPDPSECALGESTASLRKTVEAQRSSKKLLPSVPMTDLKNFLRQSRMEGCPIPAMRAYEKAAKNHFSNHRVTRAKVREAHKSVFSALLPGPRKIVD